VAALRAILSAVRRAVQRDLSKFQSLRTNNFFLFVALVIYDDHGQELAAEPFILVLGILLLFPISSDPLDKIPPSRLSLWPLTKGQRFALRLASLGLSPVTWVAVFILFKTSRAAVVISFLTLAIGIRAIAALGSQAVKRDPHWHVLRHIPQFPGRLGGLLRNNFRELLSLLDPYLAMLLSAGGCAYRFLTPHPDPAAFPILSILVALALSTYAQSLFGLDLGSGMTRYHLLPLRGWEILIAKDIAFLAILIALILPLSLAPGLTFGLFALALGHHSSVYLRIPQQRWRFTGGRLLPVGAIQALGGITLAFAGLEHRIPVLIFTFAGYLLSLYWYGHSMERVYRKSRS
jgi:hypothetical protein